jgi:hypothetical protein
MLINSQSLNHDPSPSKPYPKNKRNNRKDPIRVYVKINRNPKADIGKVPK